MKPELDRKRVKVAELLANVIQKQIPIVWQDESSLNSFTTVAIRSWSRRDAVNIHHRDAKRFSVTVYGAISSHLEGKFVYMLGTSHNSWLSSTSGCNEEMTSAYHQAEPTPKLGRPPHAPKSPTAKLKPEQRPDQQRHQVEQTTARRAGASPYNAPVSCLQVGPSRSPALSKAPNKVLTHCCLRFRPKSSAKRDAGTFGLGAVSRHKRRRNVGQGWAGWRSVLLPFKRSSPKLYPDPLLLLSLFLSLSSSFLFLPSPSARLPLTQSCPLRRSSLLEAGS